jgi:hypothetical protein
LTGADASPDSLLAIAIIDFCVMSVVNTCPLDTFTWMTQRLARQQQSATSKRGKCKFCCTINNYQVQFNVKTTEANTASCFEGCKAVKVLHHWKLVLHHWNFALLDASAVRAAPSNTVSSSKLPAYDCWRA